MMSSPKAGRPRSQTSRDAILAAAFALLCERGYSKLTMDGVAVASGCAKTTIYRWWSSRSELAVDAFFSGTRDELAFPDTGSARGDFIAQITELAVLLAGDRGAVLASMLGGARTEPELAKALGERWLDPRRKWGFERMMRAKANGELKSNVDAGAALAVLYGPLYSPLLFGQPVPNLEAVERILKIATDAIFENDEQKARPA
jgi:AcrR family transcriptional regulator